MAQVSKSEVVALGTGKIEISTNDSDWHNISGYGFTMTAGGGERMTGVAYTLDGTYGIPTSGKAEPVQWTFEGLYTEDTNSPYTIVYTQFSNGGDLYVRYSPKAGTTGDIRFKTGVCDVLSCLPPSLDPASGDPTMFSFTVRTASITRAAIT